MAERSWKFESSPGHQVFSGRVLQACQTDLADPSAGNNPVLEMILFMADATVHLHRHDLPDGLDLGRVVAVDTEAMGLDSRRDRLCLVFVADE